MTLIESGIKNTKSTMTVNDKEYVYYRLSELEDTVSKNIKHLPFSIKVILESALREYDGVSITQEHIRVLANWPTGSTKNQEVPFKPARVLLHDTTGVPAIVDLAALREEVHRKQVDPLKVNPVIPVDLIVDHSVMVDYFGTVDSIEKNERLEFSRNFERFRFLNWAQHSFNNFRVFPPSTGIMHQINLEYLSKVAVVREKNGENVISPDSLVGTDSHTTMINGLGVVGYGVGGIEAEAGILGQPLYFVTPEVIGFKLTGALPEGSTATDLALTVTNLLRKKGVVGKFVEFFGPGVRNLSLFDRSTIANMAPEYGATMGIFPVDKETINYLRFIGRSEEHVSLVESYYKKQGMFYSEESEDPVYSDLIELNLSTVVPCLAGPKRPQDRIELNHMKKAFIKDFSKPISQGGFHLTEEEINKEYVGHLANGEKFVLKNGAVVLAAITSCTNTSNPNVLVGAGLIAKKAIEKGLKKPSYVKSSLTPGSRVVTDYLKDAGLLNSLEYYGFHVAGYGCATCIGNSGPLPQEVSKLIDEHKLTVAGVLSGNRNFEGRIHPLVKANYLASPMLVVVYALAGTVNIDLVNEPIGYNAASEPVYLKDIWPTSEEIEHVIHTFIKPELFEKRYQNVMNLNKRWNTMEAPKGVLYDWDPDSTYIQEPPFVRSEKGTNYLSDIKRARVLALLGDSVTTDHASPSGAILSTSPAGEYLKRKGLKVREFNSYPSRRGNHEVMVRGAFANLRIRNQIVPGKEGGYTKYFPTQEVMPIYDASMKYKEDRTNLIVIAGKEYGTGSSRDWAAKGPKLLGVKAVIAESFERIHRSNLVGMGVLPLQFTEGDNAESINLLGNETFNTIGLSENINPGQKIRIVATSDDGTKKEFNVLVRLDSVVEIRYYQNGGILPTVARKFTEH